MAALHTLSSTGPSELFGNKKSRTNVGARLTRKAWSKCVDHNSYYLTEFKITPCAHTHGIYTQNYI